MCVCVWGAKSVSVYVRVRVGDGGNVRKNVPDHIKVMC